MEQFRQIREMLGNLKALMVLDFLVFKAKKPTQTELIRFGLNRFSIRSR
jgi:hypothetical protein